MEQEKPRHYQVYLLRCWEERRSDGEQPGVWRFCIKDPRTGKQRGFGSLEALVDFLNLEVDCAARSLSNIQLESGS